jgi:hypothetical protein
LLKIIYITDSTVVVIVIVIIIITPWSRVLLEKLIVTQLVKKFPTFYGTQRFFTVLTGARNWSLL